METKTNEKKQIKLKLWIGITFWVIAATIVLTDIISIILKYNQIIH